jgi:hypothetical protein
MLRRVVAWGNPVGYAGTNSRYVTVTTSKLFNNGAGVVQDVVESERFMPHEDNAIVGNEIFWNNFNPYAGAPFKPAGTPYPVGLGLLLLGGRDTTVAANRVYGNWLAGHAQIAQSGLSPANADLGLPRDNEVEDNGFGLDGGADRNGRDLLYDGSGSGNCFGGNTTQSPNVPADNATLAPCPKADGNAFSQRARDEALSWFGDPTHEAHWIRSEHRPIAGITPLEHWDPSYPSPGVR